MSHIEAPNSTPDRTGIPKVDLNFLLGERLNPVLHDLFPENVRISFPHLKVLSNPPILFCEPPDPDKGIRFGIPVELMTTDFTICGLVIINKNGEVMAAMPTNPHGSRVEIGPGNLLHIDDREGNIGRVFGIGTIPSGFYTKKGEGWLPLIPNNSSITPTSELKIHDFSSLPEQLANQLTTALRKLELLKSARAQ